jgi:hypothetical protein
MFSRRAMRKIHPHDIEARVDHGGERFLVRRSRT